MTVYGILNAVFFVIGLALLYKGYIEGQSMEAYDALNYFIPGIIIILVSMIIGIVRLFV